MTYHISVEPLAGTYYPFLSDHTDLDAAKRVAQRAFRLGGCRTVAVIKIEDKPERQIIDIFDGEWLSSRDWSEEAAIPLRSSPFPPNQYARPFLRHARTRR